MGRDILRRTEFRVMEHFLVGTISEVHLEVMEQQNPSRVAKNEM
jgi:hypothetical protein